MSMIRLYLFLIILLVASCGSRQNKTIEEPAMNLDWEVGNVQVPNGICEYYRYHLSEPNSIDDLISFMEYVSSLDSNLKWNYHYSIEYLKNNYDHLTFEKIREDKSTRISIWNDGELIAEEGLCFPDIDGTQFLTPVILDSSQQRIYGDSLTETISNSLIGFIKKRRVSLERQKTSSQKIIKEGIIFEFKQNTLLDLISGDTLDIKMNSYYKDVYNYFDSLATNNGWNRIAIVFWDLKYE